MTVVAGPLGCADACRRAPLHGGHGSRVSETTSGTDLLEHRLALHRTVLGVELLPMRHVGPSCPHGRPEFVAAVLDHTFTMTTRPQRSSCEEGLGEPLVLPCGAVLSNRLVKAAMSEQLADRRNGVSGPLVHLYERWSQSGCGLLITGNMMVDRSAISEPRQVVIEAGQPSAALTRLAVAAKAHGASIWAQLNHGGRQIPRFLSRDVAAPSAVPVRALGAFRGTAPPDYRRGR